LPQRLRHLWLAPRGCASSRTTLRGHRR
jgi:hypothetical protein